VVGVQRWGAPNLEGWEPAAPNGCQEDRSRGQNKFNDGKGNYMKIGIYKWPWNPNWTGVPSQVDKRVMYYDELRIADG
jgi:hypothetical protein